MPGCVPPLASIVRCMEDHPQELKHVGFLSAGTLRYAEQSWTERGLPEVCNDVTISSCSHSNVKNTDCSEETPETGSPTTDSESENFHSNPRFPPYHFNTHPFVRLNFWHDKPHLAATSHYSTQVFSQGFFKRGDFIEDVYGHVMIKEMREAFTNTKGAASKQSADIGDDDDGGEAERVAKARAVQRKFGAWLYYPYEGRVKQLVHLHGRKWVSEEEKRQKGWLADSKNSVDEEDVEGGDSSDH